MKILYRAGTNPPRFYVNFDGVKPSDGTRGRAALLDAKDAETVARHLKLLGFGNYTVSNPNDYPLKLRRK